jgi:ABC-type multidrug transport system ATPase subunit
MEKKRRFLKILDLQKQYSNGYKAVNGINLRMYEGQIFALLGHNGAGKTTTIKMLTGLLEPTEGEAFVYGYRVFSQGDMDTLRRYMGVCPQNNVLFDLLTPVETLRVFQNFKGASGTNKEKKTEIQKLL